MVVEEFPVLPPHDHLPGLRIGSRQQVIDVVAIARLKAEEGVNPEWSVVRIESQKALRRMVRDKVKDQQLAAGHVQGNHRARLLAAGKDDLPGGTLERRRGISRAAGNHTIYFPAQVVNRKHAQLVTEESFLRDKA